MKKIGFKNFRRFEEFPAIQLSPITFFVGRNNSGKSTFVKALLLINEYIKSDDIRKFSFANDVLNDVNIVTFGRAKNRNQPNNDGIEFSYLSGNHLIEILITGKDEDVAAKVLKLQVSDLKDGYYLQMFPGSDAVEVNIGKNRIESDQKVGDDEDKVFNMLLGEIAYFENRVLQLTKEREDSSNKKDGTYRFYLEAIDILNRLKQKRDLLIRNKERFESDDEDDTEISTHESNNGFEDKPFQEVEGIPFFDDTNVSFKNIVSDIIFEIEKCYNLVLQADDQNAFQNYSDEGLPQNYSVSLNNSDYILIFDEYDMYRKWSDAYFERNEIRSSFEKFFDSEFNNVIIYLGATSIKQSALFSIKDTENPLAKAINDYKQLKIDTNSASTANKFIKKWIKEFEIGDDIKITMHAGEAYECQIIENGVSIPLADKGMGSIQAMLLILRLASIIEKYDESEVLIRVIIEEPELNLHPLLQSKLADLFLYVNELHDKKQTFCKIEFIVETHSEYLIRKTQLLVKENEFEVKPNENPFGVFYFDKDMKQWEMQYREDGKFINEFGSGFFDETRNIVKKMM